MQLHVAIKFMVIFILTLTSYCYCYRHINFILCWLRGPALDKASTHDLKHHSPGPQEKVLYEQVRLPSHTVTMDTNPAYESSQ